MANSLQQVLSIIRKKAKNTSELGAAFAQLSKVFFEHDATQTQQYAKVWHYADWAKNREGYSKTDIGIDLVAEMHDGSGYCAIQCKCYLPEHRVDKPDIDSFISASATSDFTRLVLIDTSVESLGKHAQQVVDNLDKEYLRIQLVELEQSRIDWLTYINEDRVHLHDKKTLRDHQMLALQDVKKGLEKADRGKLIMACGMGKTLTSLRIAESLAGKGKRVLYMVPSLSLMSQTVREWKNDAINDFAAFSACSDIKVGKRRRTEDAIEVSLNDLAFPATTDAQSLADQIAHVDPAKMTVVFSTYHSIDVISQAQRDHGLAEFDLIICDEAHRTTGATLDGDDESNFVRIHDNANVSGTKRLYMTATPRIYGEPAKKKAEEGKVTLASMDDEDVYGKVLFYRGFGWAVEHNLLTDFKVVVLAVDEGIVAESIQRKFEEGSELQLDDVTKMVGCYKALAKIGFVDRRSTQTTEPFSPMKRAIAYCHSIKLSKLVSSEFAGVVREYTEHEQVKAEYKSDLVVELDHVDGSFNAERRTQRLDWLQEDTDPTVCRVLTNARCLSEGVDVPALDAVLFLHPRNSQVDVVQSVGRVMRKAAGKELGYVILPITVAPGVTPERALNNNEKYKVVWQILNALRAHDERFDSTINKIGIGEDVSDRIEIVGVGTRQELKATTAVVEDVKPKPKKKKNEKPVEKTKKDNEDQEEPEQLGFVLNDLSAAIKAKIVKKCGTRDYWETWATDIAKIAQAHITRITATVVKEGSAERETFLAFLNEIRDDLNPAISETEAIEMLAQHIITKPVFDTLFQGNQFTTQNAVSKALEGIVTKLHARNIQTESTSLGTFYQSVERRADAIVTSRGRQTLINELYDRFFQNAFPLTTQRLGIVYTPIEVVDFILHSVQDVLQDEFGTALGDKQVHILDPFAGTGTFTTRLLQSGLISKPALQHKFEHELHTNELVLLAYYIASVNIESVYQEAAEEDQYRPFGGAVLTDTFQLYEQDHDMIANLLPDNSNRRTAQKKQQVTVILGNPPYSAGQRSANDDAANIAYPNLDRRIEETYVEASSATLKRHLYDSYIRAFRWASDRLENEGVIGFVTNAGWIEGNAAAGVRKHFEEEFSKVYVFHLRGNQRTSGELSRKEGGKIFGSGSRAPIAIVLLVKRQNQHGKAEIYFSDIGDYLDRESKLHKLSAFTSINGIKDQDAFTRITPDKHYDWVNQGNRRFLNFITLCSDRELSVFEARGPGVATNRDSWAYNSSGKRLSRNIEAMINEYNHKLDGGIKAEDAFGQKEFKWTAKLKADYVKKNPLKLDEGRIVDSMYRPFTKQKLYLSSRLNERRGITHSFIRDTTDRIIAVTGVGGQSGFSCVMTDVIPDLNMLEAGAQNFPLRLHVKPTSDGGLFTNQSGADDVVVTDGISDRGFQHFVDAYPQETFTKEDLFYYIYGVLHAPDYRERFKNNLSKEFPRIPAVKRFEEFMAFSQAGRALGDLHVNFETQEPYPVMFKEGDLRLRTFTDPVSFFRVTKMKFGKTGGKQDRATVIYNENLTIQHIPVEAYDYIVNGKPALDWVMDRQCVKTDKASGIVNDANDYANETMNDPAYPLELFQRVMTVSLETQKIVRSSPKLDID
jgi:predicted helicase